MSTRRFKGILLALTLTMVAACGPAGTPATVPAGTMPATSTPTATPSTAVSPTSTWDVDFAAYLESNGAFSGAALVTHDDEILWEMAAGLADQSLDIPNQTDTLFNLGSMNKMFTAVAIMQLVEQDRLSLDDHIVDVWPDYPNAGVAETVTIHQLLTHTSGLGDVFTEEFAENPNRYRSNAHFLPLFVDEPLLFPPGQEFSYSNAGYVVLGQIIEQVSGQGYYDYIQQHIYDPSGMVRSGSYEVDLSVSNMAIGYTTRDFMGNETGILTENTALLPGGGFAAGGGYSTVEDLFRFRNALLGFELLSPESTEQLTTGKVDAFGNTRYAYGFMDRTVAGQRVIGHTGGAPGICSFLYIYPESGYTIIVLSNSDDGCALVMRYLDGHPVP